MIPNRIARLNSNGATNLSFSPGAGLDSEGLCVNLDAAGRVIAGGTFNMINGSARAKLAFFKADGTIITGTPTPSATVQTLATQTSGEILLGGDFTSINGTIRNHIARILPNLSLEAGFNPNASATVYALALQTDGKILAGGNFTTVGETTRNNVARLYNGVAANSLYAVNAARIVWDRTGTNEATQRVTFEIDTGSGYGPLAGTISSVATGWQIIPSTPLSGATNNVRATAFPSDSHSSGTHQTIASIPVLPEISVTVNNVPMTDGASTVTFPSLQVGATSTETVTISNIGLGTLTLTSPVTVSGQWVIESQPATSIPSGTNVSFNILFDPASEGVQLGTLSIASDDINENPFTVNLSGEATAGPGGQDLTWQPSAERGKQVRALAKSSNDNVWIGGDFTALGATPRLRLALIKKDTDPISPVIELQAQAATIIPVGTINCIAQLPDGTALVGGQFSTKRLYWVGFTPTGEVTLKTFFTLVSATGDTAANTYVTCMAVQADGSVLVGGRFGGITVNNVTQKGSLIRIIFSSGVASIDPSFSTGSANQPVRGMALQTDGKIVLTYEASNSGPSAIVRIASNGDRDATFASLAYSVGVVTLDAQGRVYVLGRFNYTGAPDQSGVGRLSPLGVLDEDFELVPSAAFTLLPMADGTLVVASGSIGTLASTNRLEKFLATGAADSSFVSPITGTVRTVCSQEDGALLIGGLFTTTAGSFTSARIINSSVSASLTVVDSTRVQWLRGGALPETQVVVFDVSQDNGATWVQFAKEQQYGQGKRITGGWELTGINLPFSGILRARAYIQSAGNSSIMEDQVSFSGLNVSDLIVQAPGANGQLEIVADNGTAPTVTAVLNNVRSVTITLVNTGLADMSNVVATVITTPTPVAGTERWVLNAEPSSTIVAGGRATMIVNFSPTGSDRGLIYADLNIASSVPGLKNPYRIKLVGAAVTNPLAVIKAVTLFPGGVVELNGSFTPNDLSATAYFRYGLKTAAESTWTSTSSTNLSGFGTAQNLMKAVSGLPIGAVYRVRAFITNSSNVTLPVSSNNFVEFTVT